MKQLILSILVALVLSACATETNEQAAQAEADLAEAESTWETLVFADYFDETGTIGGGWRFEPVQSETGTVTFTRAPGALTVQTDVTADTIWWNAPLENRPYEDDYILRVVVSEPQNNSVRYGMVFWWESTTSYYSLLIGAGDTVTIDRTEGENTATIFTSENTSSLQPRTNALTVLVFDQTIANVFINSTYLTTLTRDNNGNEFAIAVETPANTTDAVQFNSVEILAP